VFRMFSRMTGQRVAAESDHAVSLDAMIRSGVRRRPDVAALATLDRGKLCVMAWHYHDDDLPGDEAQVSLKLEHLPAAMRRGKATHYRIDREHSNAYQTWLNLGSPSEPTPEQYAALEQSSELAALGEPAELVVEGGAATLEFTLPRQAVSLWVVEWDK
jgi:xylan 1,4-beta-xylosidase